jgi:hypothetical protein
MVYWKNNKSGYTVSKINNKYRSGLEAKVSEYLKSRQKKVRYEALKIEWEDLRYRTYTPDFVLDNGIIIETKGFFDAEDRRKHLEIQNQHPELSIRFVFTSTYSKIYKGSKTTYGMWCEQKGFLYAHRIIPIQWLTEHGKEIKKDLIKLKTPRKDKL